MKSIDNRSQILKDDLIQTIKDDSSISIAAACFSMYAYEELRTELSKVKDFRFIFNSPAFIADKIPKEKREFFIPRLNRERSIYGTQFEVRLRNELTQKAIAKECAEWIKKKATFKSNKSSGMMDGVIMVDDHAYTPIDSFTTVDLGCEKGEHLMHRIFKIDAPFTQEYIEDFNAIWNNPELVEDVTDQVASMISNVYQENPPELIYFMTLYNIFSEFLEDLNEDNLANERTGFKDSVIWNKLYSFQKDAVLGIINKLEQYNGCILADSVGLGKTFSALAVIKYYEQRNMRVLVLCPKKLSDNWNTYKDNYINNPLEKDRLRYDVLYHTDLSRDRGKSNGIDLQRINWQNYDLVVIDESHNFRNGEGTHFNVKENRYTRLMERVMKNGTRTRVLMLSATPVNNKFTDLKNQIALAYEGNAENIDKKLKTKKGIDDIFDQATRTYNKWSKMAHEERTTDELLNRLNFDFFELLDSVTIARSRKHVQQYYDMSEIGAFPDRLVPKSPRPKLTNLENAPNYSDFFKLLMQLNLHIYSPTQYIHESRISKYVEDEEKALKLTKGREAGIKRLMAINLLKRMESSVYAFRLTVKKIYDYIDATIQEIERFKAGKASGNIDARSIEMNDFDDDDQEMSDFMVGRKIKIDLNDMNYVSWERMLKEDLAVLNEMREKAAIITPEHDNKLSELKNVIADKQKDPINRGNKKVLIFTAFADTAEYLYEQISDYALKEFGIHTALVTGSVAGKTTAAKVANDMNMVLSCFSPQSKERDVVYPNIHDDIDILIATDCISEGQNLQDCDYCINYDIHWNPVRIIQRFGRIDRIGSPNKVIQLVNFWPDIELDEYINLKSRVETRMKISVMTSTGDDDLINAEEKGDLDYRKQQLKRLQREVVDLEEMSGGISISDLGLNDFRMDLVSHLKDYPNIDHTPFGIHGVVHGDTPGVIFVLKNINKDVNIENKNHLHPFYMVYIGDDGTIKWNHLQSRDLLDTMRMIAKGKVEPDFNLCNCFNQTTKNGRDMAHISELLQESIASIINVKEESDLDSFFSGEQTTFLDSNINGLEDFELICFMVVI